MMIRHRNARSLKVGGTDPALPCGPYVLSESPVFPMPGTLSPRPAGSLRLLTAWLSVVSPEPHPGPCGLRPMGPSPPGTGSRLTRFLSPSMHPSDPTTKVQSPPTDPHHLLLRHTPASGGLQRLSLGSSAARPSVVKKMSNLLVHLPAATSRKPLLPPQTEREIDSATAGRQYLLELSVYTVCVSRDFQTHAALRKAKNGLRTGVHLAGRVPSPGHIPTYRGSRPGRPLGPRGAWASSRAFTNAHEKPRFRPRHPGCPSPSARTVKAARPAEMA